MPTPSRAHDVTDLLLAWRQGDAGALDPPEQWERLGRSPLTTRVPAGLGGFLWKVSHETFLPQVQVGFARTEVTNRDFREFVRRGGYERAEYWTDAPPGLARSVVDSTGRPGPSTWAGGKPPDGRDEHPVAGVSSYEASAYCRSLGKDLPTVFHWYHAAAPVMTTQWASFANFLSAGTEPVGGPLRLNMFGTFDMAGNVREWTRTEGRPGFRYSLGGSYIDPSYQFWNHWGERADAREPYLGFRCAKYGAALAGDVAAPVPSPSRDYHLERPPSDDVYAVLASLYEYDAGRPLNAVVESVDDTAQLYRLERVRFAAAYGDEQVRALR